MDPVSLVLRALEAGTVRTSVSDCNEAVTVACAQLKRLVAEWLAAGEQVHEDAELEMDLDDFTWNRPIVQALSAIEVNEGEPVVVAVRQLTALGGAGDPTGREWWSAPVPRVFKSASATGG